MFLTGSGRKKIDPRACGVLDNEGRRNRVNHNTMRVIEYELFCICNYVAAISLPSSPVLSLFLTSFSLSLRMSVSRFIYLLPAFSLSLSLSLLHPPCMHLFSKPSLNSKFKTLSNCRAGNYDNSGSWLCFLSNVLLADSKFEGSASFTRKADVITSRAANPADERQIRIHAARSTDQTLSLMSL